MYNSCSEGNLLYNLEGVWSFRHSMYSVSRTICSWHSPTVQLCRRWHKRWVFHTSKDLSAHLSQRPGGPCSTCHTAYALLISYCNAVEKALYWWYVKCLVFILFGNSSSCLGMTQWSCVQYTGDKDYKNCIQVGVAINISALWVVWGKLVLQHCF